jgi:Sulfotransferase family
VREGRYGLADRLIHWMAFHSVPIQIALADLEETLFASTLEHVPIARPVFVTSLPRCGTTLLLDLLSEHGAFATHRYSDMPFACCPMLWNLLTRWSRRRGVKRERAHGDGVLVDWDSPEGFEEILWRAFFPHHYESGRIALWDERPPEVTFTDFLRQHMRKIIALRGRTRTPGMRYLSKNNANIARTRWLGKAFTDATVLIPFRHPVAHIRSSRRQHKNFGDLQRRDPFALRYMRYVGHFEFGELLKPIAFDGAPIGGVRPSSDAFEFWQAYWCSAFNHLFQQPSERIVFLDYDRLCAKPTESLTLLAERLDVAAEHEWLQAAQRIRTPTTYDAVGHAPDAATQTLYERLLASALNRG